MNRPAGCWDLDRCLNVVNTMDTFRWTGRVVEMVGLLVESEGPAVAVGDFCEIVTSSGRTLKAQVVGFRQGRVLLMPLEETDGVQSGDMVVARAEEARMGVGPSLLGRILDGFGRPIDGRPAAEPADYYPLYTAPPGPMQRLPISEPLVTGIRAIDSLLTCGLGQRIGIFGGSGVGKSTLLGSMAKHHAAEVAVVALIGERNREVRDFIEHELGPEGLQKTVLIVATSDRPAPLRIRAAFMALAVAEYFRDQEKSVLLIMDSVTRLAMAQREIGLAAGEPPSQKGYTPSVFNLLPRIFERAGRFERGSITGFFTVLVEGDDFNEPIADAVRGILDGHIILSRDLGAAGHYPAIDVLQSVSRLASRVAAPDHREAAQRIRQNLATYRRAEDLINLGAYAAGSNPQLDSAIQLRPKINDFLRQKPDQNSPINETVARMKSIVSL
ncbi:MAG: FliI/YscN family ATPase [Bryobacterales bacterium]|nr:FliI/YscN family ATPase [Bryobacterales bacterium]